MMDRESCFDVLHQLRPENGVVVTTMAAVAPWYRRSRTPLDFPSCGSAMGHAADFAMGIALAQPLRPVWALNGDGSMLMSLGTLVTICQTPPTNLVLFVLQNDTFEVTGNQPIPGAGKINLTEIAQGAGFQVVADFADHTRLARELPEVLAQRGPSFVNLRIQAGEEPPPKLDCSPRVPAHELRAALVSRS
jgi:thiamine pyrophosphate-dependent acetolactate synthase large subunit-like protein